MTKDENKKATANTLGNIAKLYGVGVLILNDWISDYPDLKTEIELYIKDAKHKNAKVLPPIVIEKIYCTLGTP